MKSILNCKESDGITKDSIHIKNKSWLMVNIKIKYGGGVCVFSVILLCANGVVTLVELPKTASLTDSRIICALSW